jgi:hypothetical protein
MSKLNNPNFGKNTPADDPYTATRGTAQEKRQERENERFEKQLKREVKYGRISQDGRNKLLGEALNDFVNQIISQKVAFSSSVNSSSTALQSDLIPSVSITQSPIGNEIPPPSGSASRPSQQLPLVEFDVCENGQPVKYRIPAQKITT